MKLADGFAREVEVEVDSECSVWAVLMLMDAKTTTTTTTRKAKPLQLQDNDEIIDDNIRQSQRLRQVIIERVHCCCMCPGFGASLPGGGIFHFSSARSSTHSL